MLKEHPSFVKQMVAAVDCALIVAAFALSYSIVVQFKPLSPALNYWFMLVGFLGFYLYFAWTRELFSVMQFNWSRNLLWRIVAIFLSAGILGASILFVTRDTYNSRMLYFFFAGISFVFIASEKLTLRQFFSRIRRSNRNTTPIILFGRGRPAVQMYQEILAHPEWGFRVVKILDLKTMPAQFEEILKKNHVEEVFFCIPRQITKGGFVIDPYLQVCEDMGRPARVFINLLDATRFASWKYHKFMERPTLISHTVELDPDQVLFKRIFDIAGASVGLVGLALLYPLFAAAIKLSSAGPVFFKQERVGRNGKRFHMYKFRSMTVDAEEQKRLLLDRNEMQGAVFKIRDDPRVTRAGRFMRRYSLDEMPQFINVFRGDMSLVGTRPPTPDEVNSYQKWQYRRMSIRPGLTGLWQVSGRNRIQNFNDIVRLDLKYIDSWSIWLDIKILLKTVFVIFQRDAAY
ncbi:MAG TPA: sugar transferase [Chitinivibrionales bacterium]|nr:sugar transferase [Chitinivibrionales bacterium]